MANKTKNMQQIRHILQLRAQGIAIREIVHRSGISRPTVRAYLRRWEAMGLSWEQLGALDDEALGAIVYPLCGSNDRVKIEVLPPKVLRVNMLRQTDRAPPETSILNSIY